MQIKLFTIPVGDTVPELEELNRFLRSNRIIDCAVQLASTSSGVSWCFCVKYIYRPAYQTEPEARRKKDYKEELDEGTFKVFSALRAIRKQIATDDSIPAYAVCTDEELAAMAALPEINKAGLLSVKGFGERKYEKFGVRIVEYWKKANETNG